MGRRFAVFDIDGTIARTGLFFQVVAELIATGQLPADIRVQLDEKLEAYRRRTEHDAFHAYTKTAVDTLFAHLRHVKVADYREAVDRVIDRTHLYTYVYTRELIRDLKERGYFLTALSGSETYTITSFTNHFGFDVALGDRYLEKDGYFTGEIESVLFDKGTVLQRLVKEHNLSYKESIAIGDSRNDGKMLELVEQPIAFNPERGLYELAREHGWKIVIERKNMIYTLEQHDGSYVLAETDA